MIYFKGKIPYKCFISSYTFTIEQGPIIQDMLSNYWWQDQIRFVLNILNVNERFR